MTIRKHFSLFWTFLVCMLSILAITFYSLIRSVNAIDVLSEHLQRTHILVSELARSAFAQSAKSRDYVNTGTASDMDAFQAILGIRRGEVPRPNNAIVAPGKKISLLQLLDQEELSENEFLLLSEAEKYMDQLVSHQEAAMVLARVYYSSKKKGRFTQASSNVEIARSMLFGPFYSEEMDRIHAVFDKFFVKSHERVSAQIAEQQWYAKMWTIVVSAVLGITILVLLVNMWIMRRRVLAPLHDTCAMAEVLAESESFVEITPIKGNNEISELRRCFSRVMQRLHERIAELRVAENRARTNEEEAVRARGEAQEALSIARNASRVKEDFLARMNHELRTPLNAINGISYLCMQTDLNAAQHDYLEKIRVAGLSLLKMLDDLLEYTGLTSDRLFFVSAPIDLLRLSMRLGKRHIPFCREKGIQLHLSVGEYVPAEVVGNEHHLEQVLSILLDNGIKFTSKGRVLLAIDLLARDTDSARLRFTVEDTGCGMNHAELSALFTPFRLGEESMTRREGGLGLRLALAKQLTEAMGGTLQVRSAPNVGSAFLLEISFPCEADVRPCTPIERDIRHSEAFVPRVLVVEDNSINQQIAEELLRSVGVEVTLASNGEEALVQIQQENIDLVLMDVRMPVMDGLQATRYIRALGGKYARLPILAMTAHATDVDKANCIEAGMSAHLTKPIDPVVFYSALEEWLPCPLPGRKQPENGQSSGNGAGEETTHTARLASSISDGEKNKAEMQGGNVISLVAHRNVEIPVDASREEYPGFNMQVCLRTVAINRSLYVSLLSRFAGRYGSAPKDLRDLLERGKIDEALCFIHSVKGIAANLGADDLSKVARTIENHLTTGVLPAEVSERFEAVMGTFLASCSEVLHQEGEGKPLSSQQQPLDADVRERFPEALRQVPRIMEFDWGRVHEAMSHFVKVFAGTPWEARVQGILIALDDFDVELARTRCVELAREMEAEFRDDVFISVVGNEKAFESESDTDEKGANAENAG